MKIETFAYTGNGQEKFVALDFKPVGALVAVDAAQPAALWSPEIWCNRTSPLSAAESIFDALRPVDAGLYAGQAPQVNTLSAAAYGMAWGKSATADFETGNYMGNQQSGRQVLLQKQDAPIAVVVKRDSTRAPVMYAGGLCVKLDGSGTSTAITGVSLGAFTVDSSNEANEYGAAGGLGEGIEYWAFFAGGSVAVAQWTGGQAAGAVVYTAPGLIRGVMLVDTLGASPVVTLADTMPAGYGKQGSSALAANAATITGNTLTLGSGNLANQTGRTYIAIVFYDHDTVAVRAPAIITKQKRAIYLPGRDVASYIDCGTSDATLQINGAISLEWYGVPYFPQQTGGADGCLISRGGGAFGAANSASWGLDMFQTPFSALHWQNTMLHVCISDRWGASGDLSTTAWRTGSLGPMAKPVHWLVTHDGAGLWKVFKNGKLVNQRNINMTNTAISQGVSPLANIASTVGHKTLIGARNGGAITAYLRCLFMSARVYARELTMDEAVRRFEIAALGSSAGDVTGSLAELWDASNAGGTLLPASVNSANNGTINAGSIVTL